MVVVGGQSTLVDSFMFTVTLIRKDGKSIDVEAFGIEKISSEIEKVNLDEIARIFHMRPSEISRPQKGEIDLLIGQQYAAFHPARVEASGHLLLMKNQFGLVVTGSHPLVKKSTTISESCLQVRNAMVMHATGTIESFFEMESLGVMCEPRCGGCKCGRCQPGAKDMSLQEEREYQMIEEGLSFDKAKGRWIAKYPWVVPPEKLPNNRCVALAILRSTEKRLAKDPEHAIVYNEQIEDMVRRKDARIVSDRELN